MMALGTKMTGRIVRRCTPRKNRPITRRLRRGEKRKTARKSRRSAMSPPPSADRFKEGLPSSPLPSYSRPGRFLRLRDGRENLFYHFLLGESSKLVLGLHGEPLEE